MGKQSASEYDATLWLQSLRHYLVIIAVANLVWEFAQMPLYTIWKEGTAREIIFAGVHCTGGDILIAGASLIGSLSVIGTHQWPSKNFYPVATLALLTGLAYTVFSEWLNIEIRGAWAYVDAMPIVPFIDAGLSPLLQWILIPIAAFWWVGRVARLHGCRATLEGQTDE